MRLFEVAIVDEPLYKGQDKTPDVIPDNAFEIRTQELRNHIKGWWKAYKKMPKGEPGTAHTEQTIKDMEQELADFEEIGEIPFTFYAARDEDDAQFFSDQFEDGEVKQVKLSAKNVATVDDLRAVGFTTKQTVSHLTPMMIHKLKQAGFDAATGLIDRLRGDEVVVFSPEQVRVV